MLWFGCALSSCGDDDDDDEERFATLDKIKEWPLVHVEGAVGTIPESCQERKEQDVGNKQAEKISTPPLLLRFLSFSTILERLNSGTCD